MREVLKKSRTLKLSKRNKTITRILWSFIFILVLFVGLGLLSHLSNITINKIETQGLEVLDKNEVETSVLGFLETNTALIYAKNNIFIYSKKNLIDFIKSKFPRVYSVKSIERDKRKLIIKLEERQAVLTWCGQDLPVYKDRFERQDCYFVDQDGFIFGKAPFFTPGVYLIIYGGIKPNADIIGQTIKLKNSVSNYVDLSKRLEAINLPIQAIYVGDDGQDALLLNKISHTDKFIKILFNEDYSLSELLNKLNSTVNEETFSKQFKEKGDKLEYIDTRFDNRIFYKFQ